MTAKISVARVVDARSIARMSKIHIEHGLPWSWTENRVRRAINHRETAVIVAREGRRFAGFAIMYFGDDYAHLNLLAVDPAYRGRGLGRRLVEWLEACARMAGIFRVRLEFRAENRAARAFYTALGYTDNGCMPGYYSRREDACRMQRDLSTASVEWPQRFWDSSDRSLRD